MKTNPVYQVLVVTEPTLLAAGNGLGDLAVGQLGIFNLETGLSVASNAALPNKFFFAVGLDNGAGVLGDIKMSAGQYIDKALIKRVDTKGYTAPVGMSVALDLTGYTPSASVDEDYTIRFVFRSGQLMTQNDIIMPSKSFVVRVPAGSTLATMCDLIVAEVNNDEEGIVVAVDDTTGVTFNFGSEDKEVTLNGINPKYSALRQFTVDYGFGGAFEGKTYTVTATPPVFEQGSGYDIVQMEYNAAGFNNVMYRDSVTFGLFQSKDMKIYATATEKYWTARLQYGLKSISGGSLEYESILETVVAVPDNATNLTFINALVNWIETYVTTEGINLTVTTTTTTVPVTTTTTTVG